MGYNKTRPKNVLQCNGTYKRGTRKWVIFNRFDGCYMSQTYNIILVVFKSHVPYSPII